jgi:signal transduction histidine kinase
VSDRIRSVSGELSTALSDIVWSLEPKESNLDSLATHLVERAMALFPDDQPRLEVALPAPLPREALSLAVRRNVLLIGLEALHNAARHAGARTVRMSLAPHGRRWELVVSDDGRGMPEAGDAGPTRAGGGVGLAGMQARANDIGAELCHRTSCEGGTEVRLVFAPFRRSRTIT